MKDIYTVCRVAILLLLFLFSCKPAEVTQLAPEPNDNESIQEEVARLIVNMPAEHQTEEIWVNERLTGLGKEGIQVLSGMLTDPAVGSDLQARYALSSLANYVARPGAASERELFETSVLEELQRDYSDDVKTFLMDQLKPVASDRSVPVLKTFLTHDKLYNHSLNVLLIVKSPIAVNSIREALPASEGVQQIALLKALGELKDVRSANLIQDIARQERWPVIRMSLFALSKIGQPDASSLFEEAIESNDGFRQSEVISFYLNYADALLDEGYAAESDRITEFFLNGAYPNHIKSSALHTQFRSRGADMLQKLIEIAQNSENSLATPALRLVNRLGGNQVTELLIEALEETTAEPTKIYFIEALGNRRDISAAPVLRNYTDHSDGDIRVSALYALYNLQGEVSPRLAVTVLNRAEEDRHVQEIKNLLLQQEPEETVPVVAISLADAPSKTKPVLIDLLTTYRATEHKSVIMNEWNSDDKQVRMAVWNFLGETGEASDANRLFNGINLDGWVVRGTPDTWGVEDGILYTHGEGSGWLSTENKYDDFVIELEYRVPEGGNSGLFIRAPKEGSPAREGLEIQILDDYAERYANLQPWQYTGSIYFQQAPSKRVTKPAGEWQSMKVRAEGPEIQVTLNGELIVNTTLINYMYNVPNHPGLLKRSGFIGLQNYGDRVDFRNITIRSLNE